jgi:hypothetical protein
MDPPSSPRVVDEWMFVDDDAECVYSLVVYMGMILMVFADV